MEEEEEEEMMMRKRMTYADMKIVWGGFVVQVSSENFIPLLRAFLQRSDNERRLDNFKYMSESGKAGKNFLHTSLSVYFCVSVKRYIYIRIFGSLGYRFFPWAC